MHVLYFHQYFCTPEGNSGIRSYEMSRHLVDRGHKVTMVFARSPRLISPLREYPFRKGSRKGTYEGIDLVEFDMLYNNKFNFVKRSIIFLKYSLKSLQLIYAIDFDIVIASSTPLTAGIPGLVMKLLGKRKPFVFEVRDLWPELPREMGVIKNRIVLWVLGTLEYLLYNKADACIALSPGIKSGIERRLKSPKPVHLIPNGCDLDLIRPGRHLKSIYPGLNETDFVSIFIGAHGIANGLDNLLNVASYLKFKLGDETIKFVMIGDGNMKVRLQKRARSEELNNVIFMDPVPKKEIMKYLWAADVGLMLLADVPAFYYGTSPNKFFDYISSGLPVLNNYPGWIADMITGNNLGIAVIPGDVEGFANALIRLKNNKDELGEMGRNARQFAELNFDRHKLAEEFEETLQLSLESFRSTQMA